MGNLGKSSSDPTNHRPFQKGKAKGHKGGADVEKDKEWNIDTFATISYLTQDNAKNFDLIPTGATVSVSGAGASIRIYRGLKMVFTRKNKDGVDEQVECDLDFGVGLANDTIGTDQLAKVDAVVDWDFENQKGDLVAPKPKEEKKTGW